MNNPESGFAITKTFSTPRYHGAWFSFSGNRMELRARIEKHLQVELSDPHGRLLVQDEGPEWLGSKKIHLSYSHSGSYAILVWLTTHRIGVDLEKEDREYSNPPLELAKRFFHTNELQKLQEKTKSPEDLAASFLDLWLKKEAYAKLTRHGLRESIHIEVDSIPEVLFEVVPVIPSGYDARVAIR